MIAIIIDVQIPSNPIKSMDDHSGPGLKQNLRIRLGAASYCSWQLLLRSPPAPLRPTSVVSPTARPHLGSQNLLPKAPAPKPHSRKPLPETLPKPGSFKAPVPKTSFSEHRRLGWEVSQPISRQKAPRNSSLAIPADLPFTCRTNRNLPLPRRNPEPGTLLCAEAPSYSAPLGKKSQDHATLKRFWGSPHWPLTFCSSCQQSTNWLAELKHWNFHILHVRVRTAFISCFFFFFHVSRKLMTGAKKRQNVQKESWGFAPFPFLCLLFFLQKTSTFVFPPTLPSNSISSKMLPFADGRTTAMSHARLHSNISHSLIWEPGVWFLIPTNLP